MAIHYIYFIVYNPFFCIWYSKWDLTTILFPFLDLLLLHLQANTGAYRLPSLYFCNNLCRSFTTNHGSPGYPDYWSKGANYLISLIALSILLISIIYFIIPSYFSSSICTELIILLSFRNANPTTYAQLFVLFDFIYYSD